MDNALMIGLTRQMTLRRSMDVVANNIANANTAGFKAESVLLENRPARAAESSDGPSELQFVNSWGVGRDFGQGEMEFTGRSFDVAVEGEGFFAIETEAGEEYTRDGRFRTDELGQLVAVDGAPVLDGDTRAPIMLTPNAGSTSIAADGSVTQDGVQVGRIGVFEIPDRGALSKQGNGRYALPPFDNPADQPLAMFDPMVRQGFVERSNVQSIAELTDMMTIMRSYQSVSKFLEQAEDLNKRAIERLGRV